MSHATYKYPRSAIHWRSRQHAAKYLEPETPLRIRDVKKKPITNKSLRDVFMSPGALELKRRTPFFKKPAEIWI